MWVTGAHAELPSAQARCRDEQNLGLTVATDSFWTDMCSEALLGPLQKSVGDLGRTQGGSDHSTSWRESVGTAAGGIRRPREGVPISAVSEERYSWVTGLHHACGKEPIKIGGSGALGCGYKGWCPQSDPLG